MRPRPAPVALREGEAAALLSASTQADAATDLREVATPHGLVAAFVALATALAARGRILEYMAVSRAQDGGLLRCTSAVITVMLQHKITGSEQKNRSVSAN